MAPGEAVNQPRYLFRPSLRPQGGALFFARGRGADLPIFFLIGRVESVYSDLSIATIQLVQPGDPLNELAQK